MKYKGHWTCPECGLVGPVEKWGHKLSLKLFLKDDLRNHMVQEHGEAMEDLLNIKIKWCLF